MPMVNCKVEMRLKWTKHCVLTIAGVDHAEANRNNIILTIKDKKTICSCSYFTSKAK